MISSDLQGATEEFVAKCLRLYFGLTPNPYNVGGCTVFYPREVRLLEQFVGICIELKMLPDLRRGWDYPSSSEQFCASLGLTKEQVPAFLIMFRKSLGQRLPAGEFLGD